MAFSLTMAKNRPARFSPLEHVGMTWGRKPMRHTNRAMTAGVFTHPVVVHDKVHVQDLGPLAVEPPKEPHEPPLPMLQKVTMDALSRGHLQGRELRVGTWLPRNRGRARSSARTRNLAAKPTTIARAGAFMQSPAESQTSSRNGGAGESSMPSDRWASGPNVYKTRATVVSLKPSSCVRTHAFQCIWPHRVLARVRVMASST